MKKTFLFFTAVMAVSCGFASGILHTAGSFLDGVWREGDSYIDPSDTSIATSAVVLTATPERGYCILGWYYRTTQNISGSQALANWTELSDSGYKMSYTIPAESPFASSFVPFPVNYIALNLSYVKFGLAFNLNGGPGNIPSMTDLCVTNSVVLPTPMERVGYSFVNWRAENGNVFQPGTPLENVLDLGIGNVDTNLTLTAQWAVHAYDVAFNANGGTGSMASMAMTYDVAANLTSNAFTRVGYAFAGWATSPDGAVAYADGASVRNLASAQGATVNLYAKWTANTYRVTLGKNGGSGGDNYVTVTYDRPMPTPRTAPTRTGYAFGGYFDTTGPNGKQYYDADMNSVRSWDKTAATTLWAKWTAHVYTITFDANGGSGSMSDIFITYGVSTNLTPNAFTKEGYSFEGWATSPNGSIAYLDGASVKNLSSADGANVTLYAKWTVKTYKVTLGKNGGSGGDDFVMAIYGQPMPTSRPAPTRTGYAFGGYFDTTGPNGKQYYGANMNSVRNWDKTAATTLWAKWTAHTYEVAFNANGGSGEMPDILMTYDVSTNLTLNAFTKVGYTFAGWATSPNGEVAYADGASVKNLASGQGTTVNLYAVWVANAYRVTFGKNGGSGGDNYVTVTYDRPMPTPRTAPTRAGYAFGGYYDTTTGPNGKQYYDAGMNSVRNWDKTAATTLWAKWTANTYTVTLGKNGGTGGDNYVTATYDQPMPASRTAPTRTGYTFVGYFDSTLNPNGKQYYDAEMNSVRNWDKTTANPSLWAKWTAHVYTITFNANGGGGTMPAMSMTYDVSTNLTLNSFTKEGYTFVGWATSANGPVVYENGVSVENLSSAQDAEVTLYAKWVVNTYYVRFNPNGGDGTMPILTNSYDVATVFPENAFTRSEFWRFSCWSNTVDGTTALPGDPLFKLTAEQGATVVFDAVWETTLSKLSLAMHCYNLDWTNRVLNTGNPVWIDEWSAGLGYQESGSQVSQELLLKDPLGNPMQAAVSTNGTMSFYCRMASGNSGLLRIWVAEEDDWNFNNVNNSYAAEVSVAAGDVWTKIEFDVPQTDYTIRYVNIASRESSEERDSAEKLCIDQMTWSPEGSHIEPTEKDVRNFTSMMFGDGGLSLAFSPDSRFAYNLHGTNDLTAARLSWPVLLTTNGTDAITIIQPVDPAQPCMFYYLETIAK